MRSRSAAARLASAAAAALCAVLLSSFAPAPAGAAKPSPHQSGSTSKAPEHQQTGRQPGSGGKKSGDKKKNDGKKNGGKKDKNGNDNGGSDIQTACTSPPTTGSATSGTPWPQQRLNFRSAWPVSTGDGVAVAVIDSGVDQTQPQMSAIHYRDPHNVISSTADVRDCVGHGTAVTGIIAAPPRSDTSFVGVAPGVTVIPVRQTDQNGKGSSTGIAAGIDWAVDHGARVVNISAGTSTPSTPIEESIARARAHGVVIVCSAGNDGQTSGVLAEAYPAAYATDYPNVIAVAAVDQSDIITNFSELGGYTTLSAPGVDVIVPALRSGYRSDEGTSFAAPFVTGTVALMLGANPSLTPAQVRARLIATADPPPKTVPDPQYGFGIVNPYRAVTAIMSPSAAPVAQSQAPLPPVAAPAPPDRTLQHVALGLSAGFLVLAGFLVGGWALARRRRAALHVLHPSIEPVRLP